jgi:hypothetical protein
MRRNLKNSIPVVLLFVVAFTSSFPIATAQITGKRNWTLSFGIYNPSRSNARDLPVQVFGFAGGKLGPNEKTKFLVTKLKNNTNKRVKGIRFTWFVFDAFNLDEMIQSGQTGRVDHEFEANTLRNVEIHVFDLEDIPLFRDGNPQGAFHLEVAATEVFYEDGSSWTAESMPGKVK